MRTKGKVWHVGFHSSVDEQRVRVSRRHLLGSSSICGALLLTVQLLHLSPVISSLRALFACFPLFPASSKWQPCFSQETAVWCHRWSNPLGNITLHTATTSGNAEWFCCICWGSFKASRFFKTCRLKYREWVWVPATYLLGGTQHVNTQ